MGEGARTPHMILHLIQWDTLLTVRTHPQLPLLPLRQRPGYIIAPNLHLSLSQPLFCGLLRLPFSILLLLPFPVFIVRAFHLHIHSILILVSGLLALLPLVLVVRCLYGFGVRRGHGLFDTEGVRVQGHHGLLFERGMLEVGEGGRWWEVGLVISIGEDDGFDDDEVVPVDLGVRHCTKELVVGSRR